MSSRIVTEVVAALICYDRVSYTFVLSSSKVSSSLTSHASYTIVK
jgi:hypothetical protein